MSCNFNNVHVISHFLLFFGILGHTLKTAILNVCFTPKLSKNTTFYYLKLIKAGYINIVPNEIFMIKIEDFWMSTR